MPVTCRACAVTAASDNPTQYESSKNPLFKAVFALMQRTLTGGAGGIVGLERLTLHLFNSSLDVFPCKGRAWRQRAQCSS